MVIDELKIPRIYMTNMGHGRVGETREVSQISVLRRSADSGGIAGERFEELSELRVKNAIR